MPDPTKYNFTNAWFFSDEEGGNPFRFDQDGDRVIGTNRSLVESALRANFTFGEDPADIFNYGLITGLTEGTSLIFLGDLVDNEKYSIRCLRSMISLKQRFPDNVLLIGGNRDFNKIRIGFELFFINEKKNTLPWIGYESLGTLLHGENHVLREGIPSYLQGVQTWDVPGVAPVYSNNKEFKNRVEGIFSLTMGAGDGSLLLSEVRILFPELEGIISINPHKFLCLFHMLMAFEWDISELPDYLQGFGDYVGLYPKYLRLAHVAAKFKIGPGGDNPIGVVSHGGFPFLTTPAGETHRMTAPLGYIPTTATPVGLNAMLLAIEQDKEALLNSVQKGRDTGLREDIIDIISRFVHITAGTTLKAGEGETLTAYSDANKGAPIVSGTSKTPGDRNRPSLRYMRGGAWYTEAPVGELYQLQEGSAGDLISWDIFGHAPQGYLPTANRNEVNGTLYACLDVSKIDGSTNSYSFAFLHLTPEVCEFVGRVVLNKKDPMEIIQLRVPSKSDKILYYKENISTTEIVKKDNKRKIFGYDISVEYKGRDRKIIDASMPLAQRQFALRGGRRLLSKNKSKRATKRQRKQKSRRAKTRRS